MRSSLWLLAFAASASLGAACSSGDSGLSIGVACTTFCDSFVECTVTNPDDEDNVQSACMNSCEDLIVDIEARNDDMGDCNQAYREYTRCLGAQATCEELASEMLDQETCRSELFDVAEFCPAPQP